MSYRRKAPATKTLSVTQQLNRIRNAAAGPLPFQVHNSIALLEQMKQFQRPLFDKFSKEATSQMFYPARAVSEGLLPNPHLFTIPLPEYFINPSDTADDFTPRTFYHASSIEHAEKLARSPQVAYAPRCGLSGLFYTREEVVDNLQAAAADMGFTSPFWIRADHPGLQSGFLSVREGSETICLSLTASVVSLDKVPIVDAKLLHPLLRSTVSAKTKQCVAPESIPLGMNAFTGKLCANPFVLNMPNRGLWISHDQLLCHNLSLAHSTDSGDRVRADGAGAAAPFVLIEVEQWELFNADQLTVPGRLGLRRAVNYAQSDEVFQPV